MSVIDIFVTEPTADERSMMELRIKTFIFPNEPSTQSEIQAFNLAVSYQVAYDKAAAASMQAAGVASLPQGTASFNVGTFSMSFNKDAFDIALTKKNICPYTYSLLLQAGLLYKGVERE